MGTSVHLLLLLLLALLKATAAGESRSAPSRSSGGRASSKDHAAGRVPLPPPPQPAPASAAAVPDAAAAALERCMQYEDLYQAIHADLAPFRAAGGIQRQHMVQSLAKFSTRGANKGLGMAFVNGTAYVVEANLSGPFGHHASAFFAYMQVALELQKTFGPHIPDVEFVISTSDRPMVLRKPPAPSTLGSSSSTAGGKAGSTARAPTPPETRPLLPVFRFCSSDAHADIQVPIFHFTTKKYTQNMLYNIPNINKDYPWESKKEVLFGRFAHYMRFVDPREEVLQRVGANGSVICKVESPDTAACRVRQHLCAWSKAYPDLMDIKSSPRLPMLKHAQYKYLLHVDGQALSSRIDLLMPLNSLIFKEESGYRTFYHHLLKPMVHYIPVWKQGPEDILTALEWAKAHDDKAREIAANAQSFALKYLDKRARACYFFRLLVEFSKLLRYQVSPSHEVQEEHERQRLAATMLARRRKRPPLPPLPPHSPGWDAGDGQETRPPLTAKSPSQLPPEAFGVLGEWKTVEEYLRTVPMHFERGKWWSNNTENFRRGELIPF